MKMLLLHCSDFKFRPTKEIRMPSTDKVESMDWVESKESLVVFTCVEKADEEKSDIVKQSVDAIIDVAEQVKPEEIVVYPYAHLSESLSKPSFAQQTLISIEKGLQEKGYKTKRGYFGWYKEFIVHCKGHPLAELSKRL
ncbi:MAG: threonyl-tRNA synthetase editing domain-containing protein [Candidatus Diapherotrites archaeon]|nr:threonyl-tRNA synthetase editing domain-containing protein [Candidatus Diapherotrites archaeon]